MYLAEIQIILKHNVIADNLHLLGSRKQSRQTEGKASVVFQGYGYHWKLKAAQ